MKFTKISATGNDFILFDNRKGIFSGEERRFFQTICERRRAVGADGVILLETSVLADFRYRHFNSDGSPAEMCGNGARAVCFYAVSKSIVPSRHTFEIWDTVHKACVTGKEVALSMPPPSLLQRGLGLVSGKNLQEGGFAVVGVPHLVVFTDRVKEVDVLNTGRYYMAHPRFKNGTNVDFVEVLDSSTIRVRTFERGVEDETLSCGTGSVASAVFAHLVKGAIPPISVHTSGGSLVVDWEDLQHAVILRGNVQIIYEGELISFQK